MQAPFFKATGSERVSLLEDFKTIIENIPRIGCRLVVFPLVDNGSIENPEQEKFFIATMVDLEIFLLKNGVRVAFESDYGPQELAGFIEHFPSTVFGINYDTGNSASLASTLQRNLLVMAKIFPMCISKTVPLKERRCPWARATQIFGKIFEHLSAIEYSGNMIIQAARSVTGDHKFAINSYRNFISEHWKKVGSTSQ